MAEVKRRANAKSKYRAINREEIRLYLSERGRVSHVLDLVEEIEDETIELDPLIIQRKKIAIDTRLKLLNKYLPDEKSVEVKNAEGEEFKTDSKWTVEFVNATVED